MKFDVQKDDTVDFTLYAYGLKYEDIFKSYNNSTINIYYIEYPQVPKYIL